MPEKKLIILKNRDDFVSLNKKATRWVSKAFILQCLENDNQGIRAGFTITKKTEKFAVGRNRIKRRLREVAKEILPEKAQNNHDYVLIGRAEAKNYPYETLKKDLVWCLKKLDKLK